MSHVTLSSVMDCSEVRPSSAGQYASGSAGGAGSDAVMSEARKRKLLIGRGRAQAREGSACRLQDDLPAPTNFYSHTSSRCPNGPFALFAGTWSASAEAHALRTGGLRCGTR